MKAKITKIATDGSQFEIEARIIDNSGEELNWEQLGGFGDEWADPEIIFDPAEFDGEWMIQVRNCKLSVGDIITDGLEPELCGVKADALAIDRGADYYHALSLNEAQRGDKFDALRPRGV